MGRYAEERGKSFISTGATGNFGQTPVNPGNATGAGDEIAYSWRNGRLPEKFTWDIIVSGGTLTALTVNLERSIDDGGSWRTLDTSTNTAGEVRDIVDSPAGLLRANISVRTVNTGTPIITVRILAR